MRDDFACESRGYPITKVQVVYLQLDTYVILHWLCDK